MKNHRSYEKLPKLKSVSQFAAAWRKWWIYMQPACHVSDGTPWPLPCIEPVDPTDWEVVSRGGCNGYFLVVLTLAWWLWAVRNEASLEDDILAAIADVTWVCQVAKSHIGKLAPSDNEDEDGARPAKRLKVQ